MDSFNGSFSDELDSAFSSSIGCCEYCYADFKDHWPDVTFRRDGAELIFMPTDLAVDQSRLSSAWSPAEYSTLRRLVQCPRCLRFDAANIYLFEHRYADAEAMESEIEELSKLGTATPFLLLEHPFARKVLSEIRLHAARVDAKILDSPLYRARLSADTSRLGQEPDVLATYGPAPPAYVVEGRFNHAGAPMLYLANDEMIAAAELNAVGEECLVARLGIRKPLKILDLIEADGEPVDEELFNALANSALLAAPRTDDGWGKPQYVFSRFLADCARSAGFDAIRYGSTKLRRGVNYVVLAPPADPAELLTLDCRNTVIGPAPEERY
ncbi:MAG: RES domain-containing protein [Brevundimonas sp.]|nr:MAG: RES domain-containing protein [Brevundimonas sp.]